MGIFDKLRAKKEELEESKKGQQQAAQPEGKYTETCALCGGAGTEKKWMGQYWHKKCMRRSKKMAKGMI